MQLFLDVIILKERSFTFLFDFFACLFQDIVFSFHIFPFVNIIIEEVIQKVATTTDRFTF